MRAGGVGFRTARRAATRPRNSPFASCIGGSLSSRRSNIASKSQVKLTAMRIPSGQVRSRMNW